MLPWKTHEVTTEMMEVGKKMIAAIIIAQRPLGHPCIVLQQFALDCKSLCALHDMKANHDGDIVHQKPMGSVANIYIYIMQDF